MCYPVVSACPPPSPLNQGHVAQKLTAAVLHKHAERLAYVMKERFKPAHGEHMALLYTPSEWRVDHTQWAHTHEQDHLN